MLCCGYMQEFHCQRPVYPGKCGHVTVAGLPILFARRYYFNCIKIFINIIIIIIITNSLTTRIVGAPQMILQPVSSIFPVLHCPLRLANSRPDLINGRHDHTTAVCLSLRWPGGLRVVRLPAGSWHRLPR